MTGARTIRVYRPEDYDRTQERYRVIYFHDGENVLNSATTRPSDPCGRAHLV